MAAIETILTEAFITQTKGKTLQFPELVSTLLCLKDWDRVGLVARAAFLKAGYPGMHCLLPQKLGPLHCCLSHACSM